MSHRRWLIGAAAAALFVAALVALVFALNHRDEPDLAAPQPPFAPTPQQVARGAYLAQVGHCAGCHTARGGTPYAGGRAVDTPFGTVYAPNLTPHGQHGLGAWSAAQFWRAMHNGRSRDGRLLYPAFPYPSYTQVTREDSDALFAYLRSLPPVDAPNRAHALRFPYGLQASLATWRALYFRPGVFQPEPARAAEWNRGAYLVRGLGHCEACHAPRNFLGATDSALAGGLIPMLDWYAPSLTAPQEAGVAGWPTEEVVALLKNGVTPRATVSGPMAEVVYGSTRHWRDEDLRAAAVYLQALPSSKPARVEPRRADPAQRARGRELYRQHCADCHGDEGQGGSPGTYPALAGNRSVTLASPANLLQVILHGGFAPVTPGNPRPYGMPPFGQALNDDEVAALASFVRQSWGHDAPAVAPLEVLRQR